MDWSFGGPSHDAIAHPPMPKLDVRDLFAVFPVLPPEDQKQVALNLYELSKYHAYATGGSVGSMWIWTLKLPPCCTLLGTKCITVLVVVALL